jgi:hypothetical protein
MVPKEGHYLFCFESMRKPKPIKPLKILLIRKLTNLKITYYIIYPNSGHQTYM